MAEAMPDFARLVRSRMGRFAATAGDEVVCELAGHLEDLYGELLSKGLTPAEAEREALAWAGDWKRLERGIEDAREGKMMERMPKILLPGAVALFVSAVGLEGLWKLGLEPRINSYDFFNLELLAKHPRMLMEVAPWLLFLVLSGTLAAWLCRWIGGNRRQRLCAASFPVVASIARLALGFVFGLPIELYDGSRRSGSLLLSALVSFLVFNVLLPGVALLAGAQLAELLPGKLNRPQGTSAKVIHA